MLVLADVEIDVGVCVGVGLGAGLALDLRHGGFHVLRGFGASRVGGGLLSGRGGGVEVDRLLAGRAHVQAAREEQHQHHDQEHAQGRDLIGALAVEIVAGQPSRPDGKFGNRLEQAAVEVEEALERLDHQMPDRTFEPFGQLAAVVAIGPLQRRLAVGAGRADGGEVFLLAWRRSQPPTERPPRMSSSRATHAPLGGSIDHRL